MRHTPPIGSALLGISGATTALLIGFTPSVATAATHSAGRQSGSISATHITEAQSISGKAERLLPCGTVEEEAGHEYGHATLSPLNIRNGPMSSCAVRGKANKYIPLHYYCAAGGWTYLRDMWHDVTGWADNHTLSHNGSKTVCGYVKQNP